jgi:tRNA-binding EMAP/Myf-like protein
MVKVLDETLRSKSYIVGTNITLADAVVYHLLGEFMDVINLSTYLHVQRWFDHVQHIFRRNDKTIRLISIPKKVSLISLINTPSTAEESNRSASSATSSAASGTTQAIQKTTSTAPPAATATAAAPAVVAASDESGKVKKEKLKADKPASSAPAPGKAVKPVAPAETSGADPPSESSKQDPSKLDIRCGKVVKCWNHPESDKLLCEEIDVNDGPGVVRTIASGIRSAYSAEQLEGRMVLVLCNLKERAIAGFKSQVTDSHRYYYLLGI